MSPSVRRLLTKLMLVAAPFVLAPLIELFVLPIDFFTFRAWEALRVVKYLGNLPGPFYPNMHLQTTEQGDLGRYTPYARHRAVEWFTDRYGYRIHEDSARQSDVVIIGDSLAVGSGLTQADTLAAVLSERTGHNVYPLAPADLNIFLRERRFQDQPPKVVIVEYVERVVRYFPELAICQVAPEGGIRDLRYSFPLVVLADRFEKGPMLEFVRARMREMGPPKPRGFLATDGSMLFLEGEGANAPVEGAQLTAIIDSVVNCGEVLRQKGIHMIFLPVPNKESIYYDKLPNKTPPQLLEALLPELRERGIDVVDLQTAYTAAYRDSGASLFQPDDTHWSAEGVSLAADMLAERLRTVLP